MKSELVILGGGPGGYTAAFRGADLGLSVTLVEKDALGGVCLNVGCIPSKTLLHSVSVIEEVKKCAAIGIKYGEPQIDINAMRQNKDNVIGKLVGGLEKLCQARKINLINGTGKLSSANTLSVTLSSGEEKELEFEKLIIACGSKPIKPAMFFHDSGVWDSTNALSLKEIPGKLLIVGAGIIGLEMATVYSALGSNVTVVEMMAQIIPPADSDLVRPLYRKIKKEFASLLLETTITAVAKEGDSFKVTMKDKKNKEITETFDRILVATGRYPSSDSLSLEKCGIACNEKGFIPVDENMETSVKNIYAVGDITGNPMLAHRAAYQGRRAAEAICGNKQEKAASTVIPSVAFTNPEIAWVGITEKEAAEKGITLTKGLFPWGASGKAVSCHNECGFTKLLFDPGTGKLLGAGITGYCAGELISEAALAIENGLTAEDIGDTIHPHPSLAEATAFAAEAALGRVTDILPQKN